MLQSLEIPIEVLDTPNALEIFRGWLLGEEVIFATRGNIWADTGALGIILADLLRHLIWTGDASENETKRQLERALSAFAAEFHAKMSFE